MKLAKKNLPSNRKFGLFFTLIFLLVSIYMFFFSAPLAWIIFGILSLSLLLITLINEALLQPLNILWMKLGYLLGKIVSPIILGILFFVIISPIALITRLFGRDELGLKKRNQSSYWKDREPSQLERNTFKRQF